MKVWNPENCCGGSSDLAKKDITIKIIGRRYVGDNMEDEMEFISDGTMFDRNGALYFVYDESEFSGFPGCKTSLKLTEDTLRMKRIGSEASGYGTELVFKKGMRFTSRYNTPYGHFDMEVLTTDVKEGFGNIRLDYDVCFQGIAEGRNTIDIEIMQ